MTDTQRLAWLIANVTYLEDKTPRNAPGGYWPQTEGNSQPDPDMIDLTLVEYIDAMIEKESTCLQ
jgi:hypothetical protein